MSGPALVYGPVSFPDVISSMRSTPVYVRQPAFRSRTHSWPQNGAPGPDALIANYRLRGHVSFWFDPCVSMEHAYHSPKCTKDNLECVGRK